MCFLDEIVSLHGRDYVFTEWAGQRLSLKSLQNIGMELFRQS